MEGQQPPLQPPSDAQQGLLILSMQAADDAEMTGTGAYEACFPPSVTCYVCSQPGSTDRLTCCMSDFVYERLTAGSNQQAVDAAATASNPLLHQFVQSGKAGIVARQAEGAKHCQRHFHQACLGRRKEAVFDNRVTIIKQLKDGTQETRVKDLRHRLCGICLLSVTGSQETQYTGVLDGRHLQLLDASSVLSHVSRPILQFQTQSSNLCEAFMHLKLNARCCLSSSGLMAHPSALTLSFHLSENSVLKGFLLLAEEAAATQAARRADKLTSKMKKSLQARADKLATLGCKVALTHLSRKGRLSQIATASLSEALEACTPEQQLALQQELQKGPEQLLRLLRVRFMDAANMMHALQYCKQAESTVHHITINDNKAPMCGLDSC